MIRKPLLFLVFIITQFALSLQAQPEKVWATYFGGQGSGAPSFLDLTPIHSPDGSVYITGNTADTTDQLATPGSFLEQPAANSLLNTYLARFTADGQLSWCTYIHNNSLSSHLPRICMDQEGNVLVAGAITHGMDGTYSNNLGTPGTFNAAVPAPSSSSAALTYFYVAKFDSLGNRLWGTYLEASPEQSFSSTLYSITTDPDNNILITGDASTAFPPTFPSPNVYMPAPAPSIPSPYQTHNSYLLKLTPDGNFAWGTYLGQSTKEVLIYQLDCDPWGNIFVAGRTNIDSGFSSPGVAFPDFPENVSSPLEKESFLIKFNASGQRVWASYVPGMKYPRDVKTDFLGNCYLAGMTMSDSGVATAGVHQEQFGGDVDIALYKWTADGQKAWGTYYGGSDKDVLGSISGPFNWGDEMHPYANVLALDHDNNLLIVGNTFSTNNIRIGCTYEVPLGLPGNGLMAKFRPDGSILWGSYFDLYLYYVTSGFNSVFYLSTTTDINGMATAGTYQLTKPANNVAGLLLKMDKDYICPVLDEDLSLSDDEFSLSDAYQNYQWYLNGVALPDANSATLTAVDTGMYFVRFSDSCNCPQWSDTLAYPPPTAITTVNDNELNFTVYPNPATKTLYLKGRWPRAQELRLSIIEVSGKTLHEQSITGGNISTELDISALPAGLYLIRITSAGKTGQVKWVKHDH